jgi:hypothetical protein
MDEIISYKMCAVKVRNAKLRNDLNLNVCKCMYILRWCQWKVKTEKSGFGASTLDRSAGNFPYKRKDRDCLAWASWVLLLRSREYIVVKSILLKRLCERFCGLFRECCLQNSVDFRFLEKYIYSILFIAVRPMVCFGELARLKSSCTASDKTLDEISPPQRRLE